jgi:hypothetical protein
VVSASCQHQAVVVRGRYPNDLLEFRWVNIVLSNLKISLIGAFHAFKYRYEGLRLRQVLQPILGDHLPLLQLSWHDRADP